MELLLVHPAALRSVWDKVKEGLAQMPPEDWIPEDVYWHIKTGQTGLYVATEGDAFGGFLVLQRRETEFTGLPILHVWLAYNAGTGTFSRQERRPSERLPSRWGQPESLSGRHGWGGLDVTCW